MLKVSKILLGIGIAVLLAGCGGGGGGGNDDNGTRDDDNGTKDDNIVKTLTINTPLPGLTVSLHDPDKHFKKLETKTTGSDGRVSFDVDSDTVTASVSYTTKIEITPDLIFQAKKPQLTDRASWNCQYGDLNMSECQSADWCAIQENNATVPAWIVDAAFTDSDEYNITAANTDTNKDGKISVDEFYGAAKIIYDKDKNDAITLQELEGSANTHVYSKLFVNVPVKTYDFSIGYFRRIAWWYHRDMCSSNNEQNTFDLNLTHAGDIRELEVDGSSWGWTYNDDGNNTMSMKVDVGRPDTNGKYDYLVVMQDENYTAVHTEVLLDQTKGDLQDGITYDVSTLGAPSMKEVTVFKDINNSHLYVYGVYNSMWLDHTEWGDGDEDENKSVFKQYYNDKLTYPISIRVEKEEGNVSMEYRAYNGYYGDGKLKGTYRISDYPMLDVTVSFAGDGVQFSGSDAGKIDESSLVYQSHFDNNSSYEVTAVGTGALRIEGADIKPANLLPLSVSSLMSGDQNITYLSAAAIEDKSSDGIEIFKKGLGESSSNPRRSVSADYHIELREFAALSQSKKVQGASKKLRKDKRKQKNVSPIGNPFVIGLDGQPLVK